MGSNDALPTVVLHNMASIDGRVALSPGTLLMTDSRWPSYPDAGYPDVIARHHPQVLLEGSGSFVTPDAGALVLPGSDLPGSALPGTDFPGSNPADLLTHFLPPQVVARATSGWLAVTDSRGRVRWGFTEFPDPEWAGWHLLVLVSTATPLPYLAYLRAEAIPYLVVGDARVDLRRALAALRDELGVTTVAATGGGHLGGALLRAGVLNYIEVEVLPLAVGGRTTPALLTAPDLAPDAEPVRLRLLGADVRPDGRVLLRYEVLD